jgi:hypothetical protein
MIDRIFDLFVYALAAIFAIGFIRAIWGSIQQWLHPKPPEMHLDPWLDAQAGEKQKHRRV